MEFSKELNISLDEATNVFSYFEKKNKNLNKVLENAININNNLSKDDCLEECKKADSELEHSFKNYNISFLEEYSYKIYDNEIPFPNCE